MKLDQTRESQGHFPIVGIGASAGGLEAALELVKSLPSQTGMAFVLVFHLEPHQESQLASILSRVTALPVVQAVDGVRIESDHVYVIPPNTAMVIENGELRLTPRDESSTPHYPIDHFFKSLASARGNGAIGVILSGGGSDGAEGVRAIKNAFGTTFAQDQQSAKHTSMPYSAFATGAVDIVLPPAQIAEELLNLRAHPFLTGPLAEAEPVSERDPAFPRVLHLLKSAHSIDFHQYKPNTIRRRIGRRMLIHHVETLSEYLGLLEKRPLEITELYRDMLISVTSFFREPAMFEGLSRAIANYLPGREGSDPFRVWVAGCATGEEVYSIAIAVVETIEAAGKHISLQVFGTDVSEAAIDRARAGVYPETIVSEVSPERLRRFFVRVDAGYRIVETIRGSCTFARHDLTTDPPFSQLDLVSCRNVLIYLGPAAQQRILPALHYGLKPNGILVLGSAETIGTRSDMFETIENENKIYSRKAVFSRQGLPVPWLDMLSRGTPEQQPPPASRPRSVLDLESRGARIMRDLYAPPGVIVSGDMQVLHFHGETGFYLEQAQGEASLNLLRLARESLLYPLRGALERAIERREPINEPGVRVEHNGEIREVSLRVIPMGERPDSYLVLFEEISRTLDHDAGSGSFPAGGGADGPLSQAQRELIQIRAYLRKTVEEHEAASEELKAANEEARSSNEELQSTNEELRTAKEELQSSNEELTTVNDELKHRNDELRAANNDLNNVLQAATIPMFMVSMDLRLRRFTPAAERLMSFTASDIGQPIGDLQYSFPLDFKETILGVIQTLEVRVKSAQDRHGRWYSIFVRPYRTMDNRIEGAVVAFIDIDDLTRALDDAEAARSISEGIVETVQHPLVVLDPEMRIIRATEAFYRTFQVTRGETEGRSIDELGTGQWKLPELRRLLDAALIRDVPFIDVDIDHEFPHIGRRTMRLNARRIVGRNQQPHRLLLAIEDITERREVAEIQYRRLFESAKDAIVILDSDSGRVVDINPYFTELTRFQRGDIVGKPFWEIEPFLDSEIGRRLVPETREAGVTRYDTVAIEARDGRLLFLAMVANQYRVKQNSFIQVNIRDVTERRRTEERLRRSNLDLQQFAFAASHDLQEPLRTVTSFSQLLRQRYAGKLDEQADQYIDFIVAAADRMSQLVLDLLGYSQIVRAETRLRPVDTEAVLATVMLNLQLAIRDSGARVTFDHLPTVMADEIQLMRLLQNLVSNGIKYRGTDPPRIHLAARDANTEWVFSVQDNGVGIDPKYADQIFTVFKRLHGREYPGTGIGLAICKKIVERHGGHIWVESKPGHGAIFNFTLPKTVRLDIDQAVSE